MYFFFFRISVSFFSLDIYYIGIGIGIYSPLRYMLQLQEQVLCLNYMLNWTSQWISLGQLTFVARIISYLIHWRFYIWLLSRDENNASLPVSPRWYFFYSPAAGFLFEWMQMVHVVCALSCGIGFCWHCLYICFFFRFCFFLSFHRFDKVPADLLICLFYLGMVYLQIILCCGFSMTSASRRDLY